MGEQSALFTVAMVAIGMGLSFLFADRASPTSRALATTLGLFGVTAIGYGLEKLGVLSGQAILWTRIHAVTEACTVVAGLEWVVRVSQTNPTSPHAARGDVLLRVSQGLGVVYGLLGVALPELRRELLEPGWNPRVFSRPEYYLLIAPFYLSLILSGVRTAQLLRKDLDHPEKVRLLAFAAATPFFVALLVVPPDWGPPLTAIGEMIFLAGGVHYHVLQGQRGQFLSRFLSPQVARLVQEQGVSSAMQQNRVQLSVVACDLRGFTAFAETSAPEEVIQFLREYYGAIGEAVNEFGGSIKDFAGDGVLTLVGAPIPYRDHAWRAVSMALRIRERGMEIIDRWKRLGLELGIGVGVASGFVTVGMIDSGGRLEYAAIGPPVNLAARLCDRAQAGQVLADQRTVGMAEDEAGRFEFKFEALEPVELKGFSKPVQIASVLPQNIPPFDPRFFLKKVGTLRRMMRRMREGDRAT